MHLYIQTRGIKQEVDRLINDLQAQYLPYKYKGLDYHLQLSVRPIQLWELVMPKDSLQIIMNTLWSNNNENLWKDVPWKYRVQLNTLRLGLGAKKIPNLDKSKGRLILYNKNTAIYPIGIREDLINEETGAEEI